MSPEEFERLKEQEKAHLREMKRLRGLAADAGRRGRLASALEGLTGALTHGDDERAEITEKLQRDAALQEARFEIATEAGNERAAAAQQAADLAADAERLETDAQTDRARSTVAQMKAALGLTGAAASPAPAAGKTLGGIDAAPPAVAPGTGPAAVPGTGTAAPSGGTPPGKTLGRS